MLNQMRANESSVQRLAIARSMVLLGHDVYAKACKLIASDTYQNAR
jgi:hypothetical protein